MESLYGRDLCEEERERGRQRSVTVRSREGNFTEGAQEPSTELKPADEGALCESFQDLLWSAVSPSDKLSCRPWQAQGGEAG